MRWNNSKVYIVKVTKWSLELKLNLLSIFLFAVRTYKRLLKLTVQLLILIQLMAPCYAYFQTPRRSFVKFHPIKKNIHYRLWNPVRNGWVMKDPNDMSLVYCSCGFNSQDYNKSTYLRIFTLKHADSWLSMQRATLKRAYWQLNFRGLCFGYRKTFVPFSVTIWYDLQRRMLKFSRMLTCIVLTSWKQNDFSQWSLCCESQSS